VKTTLSIIVTIGLIISHSILAKNEKLSLSECLEPFNKVIDLGWDNIGGLNLQEVVNRAETRKLTVTVNDTNNTVSTSGLFLGDRTTAVYRGNEINFNSQESTSASSSDMKLLCTHEILGALEYPDNDFSFSSKLLMIYKKNIKPGEIKHWDKYLDYSSERIQIKDFRSLHSGGDGGIVSGGGDIRLLKIKIKAFDVIMSRFHNNKINLKKFLEYGHAIHTCGLMLSDRLPDSHNAVAFNGWDESLSQSVANGSQGTTLLPSIVEYTRYPFTLVINNKKWSKMSIKKSIKFYINSLNTEIIKKGLNCDIQKRKKGLRYNGASVTYVGK
jgi:hypothetical protein